MENVPPVPEVPNRGAGGNGGAGTDPNQSWIGQMRAVTISREYGSGGGEIAARLAGRLGWHLVDHEVIVEVARALGISESEAEVHDEHADTLASRILASMGMAQSTVPAPLHVQLSTDETAYDEARRRVVEGAIATGHAVIVGRGAQVLLASRPDVLHVRIIAPLEQRISYVVQREGLDRAAAQRRIEYKDRDRAHFLMSTHRKNPADARLYDLVVNTAVLHLNSVVDLLMLALERKARRLIVAVEALGPGAGLGPYVGIPGDIGPLERNGTM
jgi:cytidylate kinase